MKIQSTFLAALIAVWLPSVALATDLRFDCQTDRALYDGKRHRVRFGVDRIESNRTIRMAERPNGEILIAASPARSPLLAIAENGGVRIARERLTITGDSDGFYLIELTIFRAGNYSRGFVRIRDIGEGFGNQYSTITCRHTAR